MDFEKVQIYLFLVVVALTYLYINKHFDSDYYYHLLNTGNQIYPPFLSWLLSPFSTGLNGILERGWELFVLNLLFAVYLPFILITEITHRWEAGVVYLLSGVPVLSFLLWTVPGSILLVMMLLAIWKPEFILVFVLSPWIHSFWYAALALVILYHLVKKFAVNLERLWKGLRLLYGAQ